jgi:hypothetical protein
VGTEHKTVSHIGELGKADLIIMLILLSHITSALQPLDQDIFGPFRISF